LPFFFRITMSQPPESRHSFFQRRRSALLAGLGLAVAGAVGGGIYWQRQAPQAVSDGDLRFGPGGGNYTSPDQQSAELRANLCTGSNAVGTGLRGEYFAGALGEGEPLLVRLDTPMHFDATLNWPDNLAAQRPGSVRWTGWIKAPLGGGYRFHADARGMRVSIAQQLVAGPGASTEPVPMVVGRFYPIVVELPEVSPDMGEVRLEWTAPHGARYLVPRSLLFMPTETVAEVPRS
jgi:hypothetical protein